MDVELDEFDLDDVVEYVIDELKKSRNKGNLTHLRDSLNMGENESILIKSLDDQIKYEHIAKVFHKYSTDYFEKHLPL